MPVTAIAPAHQAWSKALMMTSISDTNGARPGRPHAARPATRNVPASTGVTFSCPPIRLISGVPVRRIR